MGFGSMFLHPGGCNWNLSLFQSTPFLRLMRLISKVPPHRPHIGAPVCLCAARFWWGERNHLQDPKQLLRLLPIFFLLLGRLLEPKNRHKRKKRCSEDQARS